MSREGLLASALRGVADAFERADGSHRWAVWLRRELEALGRAPDLGRSYSNWNLTARHDNLLSPEQFGEAADVINLSPAEGLFAVDRRLEMVVAAAVFDRHSGPGGSLLILEFGLGHSPGRRVARQASTSAYEGAILLLDQLHDQQHQAGAPTDIWLEECVGLTPRNRHVLGFEVALNDGNEVAFVRRDPDVSERSKPRFRRVLARISEMSW